VYLRSSCPSLAVLCTDGGVSNCCGWMVWMVHVAPWTWYPILLCHHVNSFCHGAMDDITGISLLMEFKLLLQTLQRTLTKTEITVRGIISIDCSHFWCPRIHNHIILYCFYKSNMYHFFALLSKDPLTQVILRNELQNVAEIPLSCINFEPEEKPSSK